PPQAHLARVSVPRVAVNPRFCAALLDLEIEAAAVVMIASLCVSNVLRSEFVDGHFRRPFRLSVLNQALVLGDRRRSRARAPLVEIECEGKAGPLGVLALFSKSRAC